MTVTAGQPPVGLSAHSTPCGNHGSGCNLCHHLFGLCWPEWFRGWLHPMGSEFSHRGGIPSLSQAQGLCWVSAGARCSARHGPRGAAAHQESLTGSSHSDPAP